MIVLAREARGMSQAELAEKLGMTPTNLSKIERGDVSTSASLVEDLCGITHYPLNFFKQEGDIQPDNLGYRRRVHVPQKTLTPINAMMNVLARHADTLVRLNPKHQVQLPSYAVTEKQTPFRIADKLRTAWNIDTAVIPNLTKLLENKGIIICSFDFATDRVDSRSILMDGNQPVIFYNKRLKGDRQRFSLAYELGQLVMHSNKMLSPETDVSHEANEFAAAFLMPGKEMMADLKEGVTLPLLATLKPKWKQSMISILYRADDLGLLTPNQKRYLVQQFNQQQIRRREPPELDITAEEPKLLKRWIAELRSKTKMGTADIASLFCLEVDEFIELYN